MQPPSNDVDIFSDAHLLDPYPNLDALRAQAGVVKLDRYNVYALTRHQECHDALRDWETFASGQGVFISPILNEALAGKILLKSDGEAHTRLRRIIAAPLTPKALEVLKSQIAEEAHSVVAALQGRDRIEAVSELAEHLPLNVVSNLVGIPDDGQERMVEWATTASDAGGPPGDRTLAALGVAGEMMGFMNTCTAERVKPGGWAAGIWAAVQRGDIEAPEAFGLMNDYIGPSLETTIIGTSNMIELFAKNPDQYAMLRQKPELVQNAVNEVLRHQTVFHYFSRVATKDAELNGYEIPSGSRIVVLFGSANRDERVFADPTRFDITRSNAGEHLALGHGRHACAGGNLAKLEMTSLLRALIDKVERIEFIDSKRAVNSALHVLERLDVRLVAA